MTQVTLGLKLSFQNTPYMEYFEKRALGPELPVSLLKYSIYGVF